MELKRRISSRIEKWYKESTKALLVKGARQVGKTHIIRSTLKELGCQYIEFNLIEKPQVSSILQKAATVDELILGLSTLTDKKFIKGKTVLFFDEIQRCKDMVTRIKFLVDEGSFRYIMSGSLLGVEITNLQSAPVGYLTTLEMYPLDFLEFLQVTNIQESVIEHLRSCFRTRTPVMDEINEKMLSLFDQYLVVGGMPEAVCRFKETGNLNDVASIHSDIISQYRLDFTQYEAEDKRLVLTDIYDLVPSELLRQNRRFVVTDIRKGLHFERIASSFLWLMNAGVVISVFNSTEPRIPLRLNMKHSLFKLYLSDVGLLTSIYGMSTKAMILSKDRSLNGGGLYENAVACELASKGIRPYYYNSNRLGELDFVIEYQGKVVPIQVKSGKNYSIHSALSRCTGNPESGIEEAFVFAGCNIRKEGKITYLPIYMAAFLEPETEQPLVIRPVEF